MASDNSFYIGIPAFGTQVPINYGSSCPKYIQITGISQSVEDVGTYYDYTMQLVDPSSLTSNTYIIHYCNASSEKYNRSWMNYISDIFVHNGSNQYYNSIGSLPVGTKYWTARTDVPFGNCNNSWPNFGHPDDWGRGNVQVYLFNEASTVPPKTTITLNPAGGNGGTDTVYGTNGQYLPNITPPTRPGFEFLGYVDSRNGSNLMGTRYYDPDGTPITKWTQTGGTATLYAKWRNKIFYAPFDGYCWAVDEMTPGTATTSPRYVTIANSLSCASGGTLICTTSKDSDGWSISSDGKTLTVPSGTPVGTYNVGIHVESPSNDSVDGYTRDHIFQRIHIEVKSGSATYSGIYITDNAYDLEPSSSGTYGRTPEKDNWGEYYYDTASGKIIRPATGYVKSPWFKSRQDIPASQITIDSSNRIYYVFEKIYAYQKITDAYGNERWQEIPLTWGGSHTFASLGTTETERKITQFNRDITFTFSGQGGSRNVLTFNLDDYISSPDKPDGTEEQQTNPIYREANKPGPVSWYDPDITQYSYSPNTISAGGGTSRPTVTARQSGTRTWSSGSSELLTGSLSYSYSISGTGFSINSSTGDVTASDRTNVDGSERSATVTVTVTGGGDKTDTKTTSVRQEANTHSDSWSKPVVTSVEYSYPDIGACGGTSTPSVGGTITQNGERRWTSGTIQSLSNSGLSNFTKSYSMTTGSGFSIDTSTGVITQANSRGKSELDITSNTATLTLSANGKSAYVTATCTQSGNTCTYSWTDLSVDISYPKISACGGISTPTVSVTYSECKRIWGCDAGEEPWDSKPTLRYKYSLTAPNGFKVDKYTGVVTSPGKQGKTTHPRSCTVSVDVRGEIYTTKTVTCTQSGNTYIDSWDRPSISAYSYPNNIAASGGTSTPTVTATQSGTRTWYCDAGTESLSNDSFTYSYSMEAGEGFSIDTSTGKIMAENRGTTPGVARTATAKVTVTGGDNMINDATATCTQGANVLEGITFTVGSKTIPYLGTTKGTVTARYTSGSTKDVENDANTSYTANPNIVTFNKTS